MAINIGNEYEYIDIVNGDDINRHYLKDSIARENISSLMDSLAPAYTEEDWYTTDSLVTYNGKIYRCIATHMEMVNGPFDPTKWVETSILEISNKASLSKVTNLATTIAPIFDRMTAYNIGDYVYKNEGGKLYKFIAPHTSNMSWNNGEVEEVTIADELKLKSESSTPIPTPIVDQQETLTIEDKISNTGKNLNTLATGSMVWSNNGRWHSLAIQENTTYAGQFYGCVSIDITSYLNSGYKMLVEITNDAAAIDNYNTWTQCYLSSNPSAWNTNVLYANLCSIVVEDQKNQKSYSSYLIDFDQALENSTIPDGTSIYFIWSTSAGGANTVRKANTCSARFTLVKNYTELLATDLVGFNPNSYYTKNSINNNYYNKTAIDNMLANINIAPTSTVVCWGDSLTSGTGSQDLNPHNTPNTQYPYPSVLEQLIQDNVTVINCGVGGETSWMIAARQGGQTIDIAPVTIPAAVEAVPVTLLGQERNIYYHNSAYEYLADVTNYAINCESSHALVNPCYIAGIEGTLSREKISAGQPDPENGETTLTDTYKYYFTRTTPGEAVTLVTPTPLVTYAYKNLRNAIPIIWIGQNDKTNNVGQLNAFERAREMVNILPHNKYIVLSRPSGSDATYTDLTEKFILEFGSHYINIREWLCKYGVAYANSLNADLEITTEDQALIDAGTIPSCLRYQNGVHGNYWYYQGVAKAVYDRGKALDYWN